MLPFIRNLVGVKTDQAVQSALETIVRWDPKSATEAELRTMEQELDRGGLQVAQARQAYEKEKREADAIVALHSQRLAAAELLNGQLEAATDPARKASLEASLTTQLTLIEEMQPDVEREKAEADDAHEILVMLEDSYRQAGEKLKGARRALENAQRDMQRAATQNEMAERRAEAARQAAGLGRATGSLDVALKAMQDVAARDRATAEAANAKAKLLAPSKPEQEDPNIAAAMAAASGKAPAPTSLADRLAKLKAAKA